MNNWDAFNGVQLRVILASQPELADKCDLGKLSGEDWRVLVEEQPLFFSTVCDWSKLSGSDWADLLLRHPQYAGKCNWMKLDGDDWAKLLGDCSCKIMHYDDHCDWRKLDGDDWEYVLRHRPDLAEKCDWKKLNLNNWARLISMEPDFAVYFEKVHCKWSHKNDMLVQLAEDVDFMANVKCET